MNIADEIGQYLYTPMSDDVAKARNGRHTAGVALALDEEVVLRKLLPPPGERRAIRVAAGVTAARIAAEVGVTRQAVVWWERGRSEPGPENLAAYVAVLARLAAWTAQPGGAQ